MKNRRKPDQVLVYNQKFDIPPDDRLYISIAILGAKTFGASNRYEAVGDAIKQPTLLPTTIWKGGELVQTQYVNRQEMYSILCYSKSNDARLRNWEITAALVSELAQQLQEANSIKIGQVPTAMLDVSEVDGTARLNKYSLTLNVLAAYTKTKPAQYFDTFPGPMILTNP